MNHPQYYDESDLAFIIANASSMTVSEISMELALGKSVIYNIGTRHKLTFKTPGPERAKKKYVVDRKVFVPDQPTTRIVRPEAVYSNSSPMGIASAMRQL